MLIGKKKKEKNLKKSCKIKEYRGNLPYGLEMIGLSDYEEPIFVKMKTWLTAQG